MLVKKLLFTSDLTKGWRGDRHHWKISFLIYEGMGEKQKLSLPPHFMLTSRSTLCCDDEEEDDDGVFSH
jgi:hypothetical protein